MAYTALVGLGSQIGVGITSVKLYQCGNNCTSCTPITNYTNVAVSSFNSPGLSVTGITDGTTCIKAEPVGVCSGSTQCIIVSGIPGPTPSPTVPPATPGPTPSSTAGTTPLPTPTPTPSTTNATTPGPTPTRTLTPTPSATSLPGCGSIVSGTFTGSTMNNYDDIQLNFAGVANGSIISFTCNANSRPNNISIRTGLGVIESTGWFGSSEGYDPEDYWYPTAGTGPKTLTITYDNTKTYYIDALTAEAALLPPNDESDYWEVNISCGTPAATSTPTPTATPSYYSITVNLQGMIGQNGNLQVYQSSDGISYQSSLTLTSNDGDYASSGFNGTPGYWYYLVVARTSGGTGMNDKLNLYTQVGLTDFSPGPINGAWCSSNANTLSTQDTPFQLPNPIQGRQSIIFYGGLNEGCL